MRNSNQHPVHSTKLTLLTAPFLTIYLRARKETSLFMLLAVLIPTLAFAQKSKPLRGSGRIVEKTYAFRSFDKIQVKDLVGKVEVQVGKDFSVALKADDNLVDMILITEENGQLWVQIRDNDRNRKYIEDTHILVKITLPEISVLQYKGNSNIELKGLTGRYFRLETEGNGDCEIVGSIDQLDIEKTGNGDVKAEQVKAKKVKIETYGNGNTQVYATETVSVKGSGNGDVIISGPATLEPGSALKGNGDIQRKNQR